MAYEAPNIGGGSASYPGDPNDYSGGSSYNFDWNSFATSLTGAIPGILGGTGAILAAQNGQPVTYNASGQPVYGNQPAPAQKPTDYTIVYIILAVILLLVLLGAGVYFIKK